LLSSAIRLGREAVQMVIDAETGEASEARQSDVTPSVVMHETMRVAHDPGAVINVPCRGCRGCCWSHHVEVNPQEDPAENLKHLQLEHRKGGLVLKKRADGACIHLGPTVAPSMRIGHAAVEPTTAAYRRWAASAKPMTAIARRSPLQWGRPAATHQSLAVVGHRTAPRRR
jgi:hypothetical protein